MLNGNAGCHPPKEALVAKRIVIIGGGAAGVGAAGAARGTDRDAEITVYTEYEDAAYSPCGIPYVHGGEIPDFERLFLGTKQQYADQGIDIRYQTAVRAIDPRGKNVRVGDGPPVPYDALVVTTGRDYGRSDAPGADLAGIYRMQGLEAVGLRYFTVYGPRQRPDMAIRRLCEAALSRTSFPIYGEGDQIRDFTYVDDVVDATVRAAQADAPPPILNVGGSESATLLHVIETIGELAEHEIELDRRPVQRGDVRRTGADTSLARASLGWEPQVRLTEGLAATVEWARAKSPQAAAEAAA